MSDELDPRRNVHLRPQNNPFSIFGAEAADVPDIFSDPPVTPARKAVAPVLVPAMGAEAGFSLLPPAAAGAPANASRHRPSKSGGSKAALGAPAALGTPAAKLPPPPPAAAAVVPAAAVAGAAVTIPPPPPPAAAALIDQDDSFGEEDDEEQQRVADRKRLAELEVRAAQTNLELLTARDRLARRDDELAQLHATLTRVKAKEKEENRALEAALTAIEAKLEAAVARAAAAEAESAALRARVRELEAQGGGGERLADANRSLRRVVKQAANMSLEFNEASAKSEESIRALIAHANTLRKLGALLSSLERVRVDDGDDV